MQNLNLKLRGKLMAGFIAVLAVALLLNAFTYNTLLKQKESARLVEHTYKVLLDVDEALVSLLNMETGFRGYMLTGDEAFLEPYTQGDLHEQEVLAELRELTRNNPD